MIPYSWVKSLLSELNLQRDVVDTLILVVNTVLALVIGFLLDYILKKGIYTFSKFISSRSRFRFHVYLVQNKAYSYLAHLIPLSLLNKSLKYIYLKEFEELMLWNKLYFVIISLLTLYILKSVVFSVRDYFKTKPQYLDKPVDNQAQVFLTFLWIFTIISIILNTFSTNFRDLLTAFGALSAITILVFRDSILGFIASIQVTLNDTVRIGDWITSEKFGADGYVMEINLVTVLVRNFDNTTTTVPTYSLISDSFKNWRGMFNSGGRRIKRSLFIKENSVKFLTDADLERYKEIELVSAFITHRQADINQYNSKHKINKNLNINGRNMTNLGLLRKYMNQYLANHTGLNKELTTLVRHLQPTEKGIPLEIYAFTLDKTWVNHEAIMADIFDHFIAAVPYFDLEIYELPSSVDLDKLRD